MVIRDPLHRTWNLGMLKTGDQSSILTPSFPLITTQPSSVPPSCLLTLSPSARHRFHPFLPGPSSPQPPP